MDITFSAAAAESILDPGALSALIGEKRSVIGAALSGESWNQGPMDWFSVRYSAPESELVRIEAEAERIRCMADTLIVVGIGGSNRGAAAAIRALGPGRASGRSPAPDVIFAGDSLSGRELGEAVERIRTGSVCLNVIAKDFNTVEPGAAFRVLRRAMEEKYGPAHAERILVTGSRGPGQLKPLADEKGWRFLDFPSGIGGRFSVLSAVGLLPMAGAGIDIQALLRGAAAMEAALKAAPPEGNPAVLYAASRKLLQARGFGIESLAVFEPSLIPLARWWVQLFAETEGKIQEAVFPSYFSYSEDLHAVGQYVQQGRRMIFETFLRLFDKRADFPFPGPGPGPSSSPGSGEPGGLADGFGYLEGKAFGDLNKAVYTAALEAHSAGGVPCLELSVPGFDTESLGGLFYFFLFSAYVSACLIGVNPFDQEGVEAYKRTMYRILGKGARP